MSTHGGALHWDNDACSILRSSTSAEEIQLVCSYFPFQHPDTPLGMLFSRQTSSLTNIDKLVLVKAEETLRSITTECESYSWNWKWSPPFVSLSNGPTRAANETDRDLCTLAFNVTFMALTRRACGLPSRAIEECLKGLTHELKNPLARWIFSTSLRSTGGSTCPSDAFAPILHPIKELFENRELPLISVLQRLKILGVLHQDILNGLYPRWEGLREEDFSFFENVTTRTPQQLARLLIEKDLSCSQKLYPNNFLDPGELRTKSPQWSSLVHTVRVCGEAHSDLVCCIDEAAKILLHQSNFFSGMALVYGLCEAKHPPAETWWKHFTVRHICMAYQVRGWLRLPDSEDDDTEKQPTGAVTKNGRSCVGSFLRFMPTLSTLFRKQQYIPSRPRTSDGSPEHKVLSNKGVDSKAGGSWRDGSTTAGSEIGLEMEYRVENVDDVASNLVWSGSGSSVQHVNDANHADSHDHTEVILGPDGHDDFDSDSALGIGHRYSTKTLSTDALTPVKKYGRTYHAYQQERYLMPNDEREQERLDEQHDLFEMTLGGRLHLAQLLTTQRVLDIGTGTGIWSMQFDENPGVEVLGVDLSPIQPEWAPPNCTFQVDDLSLPWTFEFPFDFIHGRMLFCSFSDPLHVFREAFKALSPGGVIEMQELIFDLRCSDHSLEGSALATWARKVKAAFRSRGIDLTSASRYKNDLETAGFEDIHQKEFIWPIGSWSTDPKLKSLGSRCQANIWDMLFAISIVPLIEHYQPSMSVEEVELLLVQVRKDLQNPDMQAYLQIVVIDGRKPKPDIQLEV
ncbi:uncharacterized protein RAG0_12613 [Rhynchosporium agropyri]|uniref:Methyltransferase domain-containing protein n=1 Tax=Rhynchosporium agropyri TaxID=914238 RepID=A0A1E1L8Y8_9HELO|nr:uncharacterized protein RAG0_12613 [Rhynchosporium agropyri]